MTMINPETPEVKQFKDLPIGATYYTVIAGQVYECVKVNAKYGRKTGDRQGKVSHWLNSKVYDTAEQAQAALDALLESGRQIRANRMALAGGVA